MRKALRGACAASLVLAAGCEVPSTAPAAGPSLLVGQFGGLWSGTLTRVSASGQCLQTPLPSPDSESVSMAVEQTDAAVVAQVTSASTGLSCAYAGRATLNTLVLDSTSCKGDRLVVLCPGFPGQIQLVGSTITATLFGGVIEGTAANTYNVFSADNAPVGNVVTTYRYVATRR
jgi:hypothetical protein